jgi:hypothetical protein
MHKKDLNNDFTVTVTYAVNRFILFNLQQQTLGLIGDATIILTIIHIAMLFEDHMKDENRYHTFRPLP